MSTSQTIATMPPQEAAYDPLALQRLDTHFRKLVDDDRLQCASYLLARNGRVFACEAFGRLKHGEGEQAEFRADSIRRIASITKLFTATAIFQLIEQGKLYLKQPVADWIEEFKHPMYERIHIWHLLTHTSGLWPDPGYHLEPYPFGSWDVRFAFEPETEGPFAITDEAELLKLRRSAWIRAIMAVKPLCKPGTQWNYSSNAYAILGEIVTRASGVPYEEYIIRNIAQPLGMQRTFFNVPPELHAEVCTTNAWDEQRLRITDRSFDPPRAGGGLYSTLEDLFRFGQMFLNKGQYGGVRVLSRKSVERMTRNHLEGLNLFAYCWGGKIEGMPHGLGPSVTQTNEWVPHGSFGHEGAGRSKLIIDPSHEAVVVYFSPSNVDWLPESIVHPQQMIWSGWQ